MTDIGHFYPVREKRSRRMRNSCALAAMLFAAVVVAVVWFLSQ